jgi:hypothetical protein
MKTMADKLKEILKNQSKEEFLKDWSEVEALGLNGEVASEYIGLLEQQMFISLPNEHVQFISELVSENDFNSGPDYSLAA